MSATEIVVIDYGLGNLLSVVRSIEHCGGKAVLTSDPKKILNAEKIVLPGVGAFSSGMSALDKLGLVEVLKETSEKGIYILGICLGMQLLFDESEEFGVTTGLGLIPGRVIPVPPLASNGDKLKIPHIGWSGLHYSEGSGDWKNTILSDTHEGEEVYFIHSYMANPAISSNRIAYCLYGEHEISATVVRDRITGCQFHPEKSGEIGLRIIHNFINQ